MADMLITFLVVSTVISSIKFNTVSIFGYGFGTVMSGSMLPKYEVGSTILIGYDKIPEIGEVGVYDFNGMNIVHRVVSIEEENGRKVYTFKGDNNSTVDYYGVYEEQIKGKVIYQTNITAGIMRKFTSDVVDYTNTIGAVTLIIMIILILVSIRDNYDTKK